jgi:uncharacterized protein YdhG (YjbR/CyaY superfamily)
MDKGFKNIDDYILSFPKDVQIYLEQIRTTVRNAAPNAEEAMTYGMPTFKLHGNLVHFAAYKNHIGFYPTPTGLTKFKDEIEKYKHSKGAVQFPIDKKPPLDLIARIVKYRVGVNIANADSKKVLKTCKNGHQFYKSTDCPTCPICEKANKSDAGIFVGLSAPAIRALENNGIKTIKQLAKFSEKEVLSFHGMGATGIIKLKQILKAEGLSFRI